MLRKKGIIGILVFMGILIILTFIFTDSFLESNIEDLGTSLAGAKVEIDGLELSIIGASFSWDRLQVTDKSNTMKNLIETGSCKIDFEVWPLLSSKITIETIELSGIETDTDRETDGKIEEGYEKYWETGIVGKSAELLEEQVADAPIMNISDYASKVNTDSILGLLELKSPERMDQLQNDLNEKYKNWQSKLDQTDYEDDLKELETKAKSIDVKNLKSLDQIQKTLSAINDVKKSADELTKKIKNDKKGLTSDLSKAKNDLKSVDDWIKDDYAKAMSLAKLPDFSAQNIGKLIFGKSVVNRISQYLGYVETARSYSSETQSEEPEDIDPPRLEGQDIYFYNKNARPDFWIQKINLSGTAERVIKLNGKVLNIVSDQRQINAPTKINIKGESEGKSSLALKGILNYLTDQPSENIEFDYKGFSLNNAKLSESNFLPEKVKSGIGSIKANLALTGKEISGTIKFIADQVVFDFSDQQKKKSKFDKIVHNIIKNTSKIDFVAKISGKMDNPEFSLNSNLDDIFVKSLKAEVSKEVDKAKQKLKSKIDDKVKGKKAELDKLINEKEAGLKKQFKKYEDQLADKKKLIEDKKKELEKEKSKLQNKAVDKLKGLFK